MSFGDTLREISKDTAFEKMVWEKMKPELIHVASDRHAKGCHVKFIGLGKNFSKEIRPIILEDGITSFSYDSEKGYGTMYWGKTENSTLLHDMSDVCIDVTLTPGDKILLIRRGIISQVKRQSNCTYIS